mgnify:CR=1 FL=1
MKKLKELLNGVNVGKVYGDTDREIGQILTGFSLSICKSIKEVPGFAAGTFDRDAAFRALLGEKE